MSQYRVTMLQRRDPLHDRLEAWMAAETLEIRIVMNPVSYRNTRFECTFESIESVVAFAEQCKITRGVV